MEVWELQGWRQREPDPRTGLGEGGNVDLRSEAYAAFWLCANVVGVGCLDKLVHQCKSHSFAVPDAFTVLEIRSPSCGKEEDKVSWYFPLRFHQDLFEEGMPVFSGHDQTTTTYKNSHNTAMSCWCFKRI